MVHFRRTSNPVSAARTNHATGGHGLPERRPLFLSVSACVYHSIQAGSWVMGHWFCESSLKGMTHWASEDVLCRHTLSVVCVSECSSCVEGALTPGHQVGGIPLCVPPSVEEGNDRLSNLLTRHRDVELSATRRIGFASSRGAFPVACFFGSIVCKAPQCPASEGTAL